MCRCPSKGLRMSDDGEDLSDAEIQLLNAIEETDSEDSSSSESEEDSDNSDVEPAHDNVFGPETVARRIYPIIPDLGELFNNNDNNNTESDHQIGMADSPASPEPEERGLLHPSNLHLQSENISEGMDSLQSVPELESPNQSQCSTPTITPTPPIGNEPALDVVTLRELILNSLIPEPVVFKGINKNWPPITTDVVNFGNLLKKERGVYIECKEGLKRFDSEKPQWESARRTKFLQWTQMLDWDKAHRASNKWIYYDYKEMKDVVYPEFLKDFEWSELGFPERNGKDSSLWIGSNGSFTPCHYDTYGCNLVCQVKGQKKWILFPPKDTTFLNPTRVPYEESSVYSQINFCATPENLSMNEALQNCSPISVILEPGDVLYVPPKWWHFVQSQEFSISVNTWIGLDEDHQTRVDEAIIRSIVGASLALAPPDTILELLNPNEEQLLDITPNQIDVMLHNVCANQFEELDMKKERNESSTNNADGEPPRKKLRVIPPCFDDFLRRHSEIVSKLKTYKFSSPVEDILGHSELEMTQSGLAPLVHSNAQAQHPKNPPALSYYSHLINAIGHPDVLAVIRQQFLHNVQNAMKSGSPPGITQLDGTIISSASYDQNENGSSPTLEDEDND